MRFYSIFILVCTAFQAASATPISIPNEYACFYYISICFNNDKAANNSGPIAVHNLQTSSHQTQLLEPRGKHYQNKQSHKHVPLVAPKITFQKGAGTESLDKHLGQLKLRGQKKKAVESYRKTLKTWRNPDTVPPPSFARLHGNKKAGEKYLKQVLNDHKANGNLAHHHLRKLGLQGKKRKAVEKYHRKVVGDHMKDIPNAHSAVIK